jgi:hypothetical protein
VPARAGGVEILSRRARDVVLRESEGVDSEAHPALCELGRGSVEKAAAAKVILRDQEVPFGGAAYA